MAMLSTDSVQSLADAVRGPVLTPEAPEFGLEVAAFNASAHHTPDVVVGAIDTNDVVQAVRWATERDLPVAVQATGHGAVVSFNRGVLVSTKRMQDLHIDPEARIARIGANVKWRTVIDAGAPYDLAPLNGSSSDVGAVGYTLGGGIPVKETGELLNDLTPEAVREIVRMAGPRAQCPLLMVELRHLGGALRHRPAVPDAVGARDAAYSLFLLGVLMPPVAEMVPAALAAAVTEMAPYTTGRTFVNLHGMPSTLEDRARPWASETYDRLVRIKRERDPRDTFRFGHSLSVSVPTS